MKPDRAIEILEGADATPQELNEAVAIGAAAIKAHRFGLKPIDTVGRFMGKHRGGKCPICGATVNSAYYAYCRSCGQRIEWRGVFRQPYREGDTVFYIVKDTKVTVILRATVAKILGETAQLDTEDQGSFFVTPDDFYYTVFPTRELAEKFLRGEFECVCED